MKIRLLSTPAISGLCAAFFFVAAVRVVSYLLPLPFNLQWGSPLIWALALGSLLFVVASATVGVRLLQDRTGFVLHGLVLGWLCLLVNVYGSISFVYSVLHDPSMRLDRWVILLCSSFISVLYPAVVVWLLHVLRFRERGSSDSPAAALQVA